MEAAVKSKGTTVYENTLAAIGKHTEYVMSLLPHFAVADDLLDAFSDLRPTITCGYDSGSLKGVLIHINDVTDMHRQIMPVQKWLVERGYHIKRHADFPEIQRRSYDYGPIQLLVFLKANEGARCSFVKVGETTAPVYKLVCEDDEAVQ